MFDDVYESYKDNLENISFKVRPDYGYGKFYLNWGEGSYDMSLHSLIYFMLYEDKHFKKFLSKETYRKLESFIKQNPDELYDFEENEDEQSLVDEIEYVLINYMKCLFEEKKLDSSEFTSSGCYDLEPILHKITKCNSIGTYLVSRDFFFAMQEYLLNFDLTQNEEQELERIIANVYNIDDLLGLSEMLYLKYKDLSKKAIERSIDIAEKNSDYTKITNMVKHIFADETWVNEIRSLKS
ncbi:MAG: hypothetical protein IE880_03465 [Epsilonproteobacteria bacterium]|nr:hypothetical protein [Campylobacterota bacterium]